MAQRRVQLDIQGDSTAVDAQLLQSLIDPLTHLLRNAVDHGIEDETQRVQAGKPAAGRIELAFEHTGRELRIRCQDDGRGLDEPAVLARAIERGLIGADARPSPAQVARLVLAPGFSTRDAATQLSGRGIGLDVVHRVVARLRGALDVRSEAARGLTVDITLPIALAGLPVLVARTPTHVLALSIRQVEHIVPGAGVLQGDDGEERFVMEQGVMPVRRLDALLGLPRGWFQDGGQAPTVGAVANRATKWRCWFGAAMANVSPSSPRTVPTRRVVVRPLPAWLPDRGGRGRLRAGRRFGRAIDRPAAAVGRGPAWCVPISSRRICLPSVRRCAWWSTTRSACADRWRPSCATGIRSRFAGDGLSAGAPGPARARPGVADLEMPRMNGVELASTMRQDVRLCEVPIIMITSRASEKHRRMAVDAGVDVFLTKPYTEDDLASQIRRCLERKALLG
jgi:chemosensory pili system protein ChpA (sensor histidine kinase/response regulator)